MSSAPNHPAVSVSGLTKRYVGDDQIVVANDNIDLAVGPGSLHAIVGENGAGKSTLAHALSGLVHPDSGTIEVFGHALNPGDPKASKAAGIGLVAQHFTEGQLRGPNQPFLPRKLRSCAGAPDVHGSRDPPRQELADWARGADPR